MTKICEQTEVLDKQSNSNELNFTGWSKTLHRNLPNSEAYHASQARLCSQ